MGGSIAGALLVLVISSTGNESLPPVGTLSSLDESAVGSRDALQVSVDLLSARVGAVEARLFESSGSARQAALEERPGDMTEDQVRSIARAELSDWEAAWAGRFDQDWASENGIDELPYGLELGVLRALYRDAENQAEVRHVSSLLRSIDRSVEKATASLGLSPDQQSLFAQVLIRRIQRASGFDPTKMSPLDIEAHNEVERRTYRADLSSVLSPTQVSVYLGQ